MTQDIMIARDGLKAIQEDLKTSFHNYSVMYGADPYTEAHLNFVPAMLDMLDELQTQVESLDNLVTEYDGLIYPSIPIINPVHTPTIIYTNFINNQKGIKKFMQNRLQLNMEIDVGFIDQLFNSMYHFGIGGIASGSIVKQRPWLKLFIIQMAGFMLIEKYDGEFFIGDGLSVRLKKMPYIIQLDKNLTTLKCSRTTQTWDWFHDVVAGLETEDFIDVGGVYKY
ncbi:MAG: hypothetical protein ABI091_19035 [Ferruginibacter sp.]